MLFDGIKLSEGSSVQNLVVASGTAFPSLPNEGELFYRTDGANAGLYVHNGATWVIVGANASVVSSVSVISEDGIASSVANATTTPVITLSLDNITPLSVNTTGSVTASAFIGNGSQVTNVAAPASLLTGSALPMGITGSMLTSVGTLQSLAVSGSGSIGNVSITNDVISSSTSTITIDPASPGPGGLVVVNGNLQVTGVTTTIDSTTVSTSELNIEVASNAINAAAANGGGLTVNSAGANATLTYASATDSWAMNKPLGATLLTPGQPNITSVGTLSGLAVNGSISSTGNTNVGSSSSGAALNILGGASGATLNILPDTASGANGVSYNTSFVSGGSGPHVFKIGSVEKARLAYDGLVIKGANPNRSVTITGESVNLRGESGTWAIKHGFTGGSGTDRGGFGALGTNDVLDYYWVGPSYDNYNLRIDSNGIAVNGTANITGDATLSGAAGTRTLSVQSNTSGNAVLNLIGAGDNAASLSYIRGSGLLRAQMGANKWELTDGVGLAVTGALSASGGYVSTYTGGSPQFNAASATTGISYGQISNTGTALLWGVDSSIGGGLGTPAAAYDAIVRTNTALAVGNGSAQFARFSTAGLAVTGALSATGDITSTSGLLNLNGTGNAWLTLKRGNDAANISWVSWANSSGANQWGMGLGVAASNKFNIFNYTTGADAIVLDTSGNLGIGVTPVAKLHVQGSIGATDAVVYVTDTGGTGNSSFPCISLRDTGGQRGLIGMLGGAMHINAAAASTQIVFKTSGVEAGRFDTVGNLLVGATAVNPYPVQGVCVYGNNDGSSMIAIGHSSGTGSGNAYATYSYNGTGIGSITQSGTTAVAFNTTSDHRLKTNVRSADATRFMDIEFVDFEWTDGRHDCGVIAHQLKSVYPDLVLGDKDATEVRQVEITPAVAAVVEKRLVSAAIPATDTQQATDAVYEDVVIAPAVPAVTEDRTFPVYQQVNYIGLIGRMGTRIQQHQRTIDAQATLIAALEARLTALENALK